MRTRGSRRLRLAGSGCVAMMLVAGVAACGGGDDEGGDSDVKVLRVVVPDQPTTLGVLANEAHDFVKHPLTDSLTRLDAETGELMPMLATSWEQVADDEWIFHLRDDVKFHDGTDFNAEAAAWSIDLQTNTETSGSRVARYAPDMDGSADDEFTLRVKCADVCPLLDRLGVLFTFSSPTYAEENPEEAGESMMDAPIGAGPYMLDEWKQGEYITYKKFDDYWDKSKTPYFDEIKIVFRQEPEVRSAMVANGEVDMAADLTALQADEVPQAFAPPSLQVTLLRFRTRAPDQTLDPIWGDVRFRQAMMYAIDCEAMQKTLMRDTTVCSPVPFNPLSVGWLDLPPYPYDPEKARSLLDEVLGEGKEIDGKMFLFTGSLPAAFTDALVSYWNDVGVHISVNPVEGARWDEVREPGAGNPVEPDIYVLPDHTNDLLDASIALSYLDCNTDNSFSYCDQEFIDAFAHAKTLAGDERTAVMEEMTQKYLVDSPEYIGLWVTPVVFGGVENFVWPKPEYFKIRPNEMSLSE